MRIKAITTILVMMRKPVLLRSVRVTALVAAILVICCSPVSSYDHSDWMGELADELLISELTIPGTHESMALYEGTGGLSKCQNMVLMDQLSRGIRFIDIRCRHWYNHLAIYHGLDFQNAYFDEDVRDVCVDFLIDHPSEAIFMRIQETNSAYNCNRSFAQTVQASLAPVQEFIYQSDDYTRIPSLGELRGKIVIFQSFQSIPEDLVLGPLHDGPYTSIQDNYFNYTCVAGNEGKTPGGKWYEHVLPHLWSAIYGGHWTLYLNYLNCATGDVQGPHGFAWDVRLLCIRTDRMKG